jgi:hypothetical protein
MRSTQPPTRDALPVDNSPRYWVAKTGKVHRTVRWSRCASGLYRGRWTHQNTSQGLPSGERCRECFPLVEVPYGRTRTGWPRGFHPLPVVAGARP